MSKLNIYFENTNSGYIVREKVYIDSKERGYVYEQQGNEFEIESDGEHRVRIVGGEKEELEYVNRPITITGDVYYIFKAPDMMVGMGNFTEVSKLEYLKKINAKRNRLIRIGIIALVIIILLLIIILSM